MIMFDTSYHHADRVLTSQQGHSLWVGDFGAAEDVGWLREQHIFTIITVAKGFTLHYEPAFKHIVYHLEDKKQENISAYFDMAAFQIEKNLRKNSVLVHCGAGVSRSSTIAIAYLIKYKGMTFHQALKHLKEQRPQVCPNLGFELQLKAYEKSHHASQNIFLLTTKKKEKHNLPDIVRDKPAVHSTYGRPFRKAGRESNANMGKSLKPIDGKQQQQRNEAEYLRKMAEFRFGITNMSLWKLRGEEVRSGRKPFAM